MNLKSYPVWLALISVSVLFAARVSAQSQTTLFSQNFDSLGIQTISNNPTSTPLGAGAGAFVVQTSQAAGNTATLDIADVGAGNRVARYTDNSAEGSSPNLVSAIFSGVNATNHYVLGSFDFKPLGVTGVAPSFIFMINGGGQVNVDTTNTSVQIMFSDNGGSATTIGYFTAGAPVSNVASLSADTKYRLNIVADYGVTGSTNFDSYSFTITNLDTMSVVYVSPVIQTRANANVTPNRIAFYGNPSVVQNASPFFEIDNINFISTSIRP